MGKLKSFTPSELIKILKSKGFQLDRVKGSHHVFINSQNGKRTVVAIHKKDIPTGTLNAILKEAGIDREELDKDKKKKS